MLRVLGSSCRTRVVLSPTLLATWTEFRVPIFWISKELIILLFHVELAPFSIIISLYDPREFNILALPCLTGAYYHHHHHHHQSAIIIVYRGNSIKKYHQQNPPLRAHVHKHNNNLLQTRVLEVLTSYSHIITHKYHNIIIIVYSCSLDKRIFSSAPNRNVVVRKLRVR